MKKVMPTLAIVTIFLLHSVSSVCADRDDPRSEIVIAIIDSGISSQRLEDSLWKNPGEIPDNGMDDDNNGYTDDIHGWSFSVYGEDSGDIWDFGGTGTMYAEIVANSCSGCRIMAIKVDSVDAEWAPALARAIIYATDNKADIISISTLWHDNPRIEEAINYANGNGAIIVASASYEYLTMTYPASYEDVIAVSSVNEDNTINYSSYIYAMDNWNFKPYLDFVVAIDGYEKSAPYLAGIIGRILSEAKVPAGKIKEHLCGNSYDILDPLGDGSLLVGVDKYSGCGKVER